MCVRHAVQGLGCTVEGLRGLNPEPLGRACILEAAWGPYEFEDLMWV